MNYWVDYEYRRQRPAPLSPEQMIESFCGWIRHCNSSADTLADSVATGIFDESRFRQKISDLADNENAATRMATYFEAIYFSVTGRELPPAIRIVEKSIENAEFAVHMQAMFPQAKFIHIVRNPYANIVALRRYKSVNHGFPLMPRLLRSLSNSFYHLYQNPHVISHYFVLRYEDLLTAPEKHMRALCAFLELPFEPVLLNPTYQGQTWSGNSTTGKAFTGIDASNRDRWRTSILPMEIYYINRLFPFLLNDYNYETMPMNGSYWKRGKGERLLRYFYNRLYRYYI
jgi:hypothetical protein